MEENTPVTQQPTGTLADLGRKVKEKHPGAYDTIPDADLGRRVKEKYPDAYGGFTDIETPSSAPFASAPPASQAGGEGLFDAAGDGFVTPSSLQATPPPTRPAPSPTPLATQRGGQQQPSGWGTRQDGTPKGDGWLGPIKAKDGSTMTELSFDFDVDGRNILAPLLVPTLTAQEVKYLQDGGEPTDEIYRKAQDFAIGRAKEGKSPFYGEGDEQVVRMDAPAPTDRFGVELPKNLSREALKQALPGFEEREAEAKKKEAEYADAWGGLSLPEVQAIRQNDIPQQVQALRGMEQGYMANQEQLEFAKTDLDGLAQQLREQVAANPSFGPQAEAQYAQAVEQYNQMVGGLNEKWKAIQDQQTYIQKQEQQALRRETELKSQQGGPIGAAWNSVMSGVGRMTSGVTDYLIDAMVELGVGVPEGTDTPEQKDALKKEVKAMMLPDIRRGAKEVLGTKSTTDEYVNRVKEEHPIVGGGLLGLAESAPAMVSPYMAGIFFQVSDAVGEEMSAPEFDGVSENEKLLMKGLLGSAGMALERFGFRNLVGNTGVTKGIVLRALEKAPKNSTGRQIANLINAETPSVALNFTSRMFGAGAAEAETGGLQNLSDIALKSIYDEAKGKDMFKNPKSAKEIISSTIEASLQEAVGGKVMGLPSALSKAVRDRSMKKALSDTKEYDMVEKLLRDQAFAEAVPEEHKRLVDAGEITQAQADAANADWEASRAVVEKIPEDLSPEQRKEAFLLLTEKGRLSTMEKALVGDRIAAIDEQLKALVQKTDEQGGTTATTEVQPDAGRGVVVSTTEDGSTTEQVGERPIEQPGTVEAVPDGQRADERPTVPGVQGEAAPATPTDTDAEGGLQVEEPGEGGGVAAIAAVEGPGFKTKKAAQRYADRHNEVDAGGPWKVHKRGNLFVPVNEAASEQRIQEEFGRRSAEQEERSREESQRLSEEFEARQEEYRRTMPEGEAMIDRIEEKLAFGQRMTPEELSIANEQIFRPQGFDFDADGNLVKTPGKRSPKKSSKEPATTPAYIPKEGYTEEAQRYVNEWGDKEFGTKEQAEHYARRLEAGEGGTWQAEQVGKRWRAHRTDAAPDAAEWKRPNATPVAEVTQGAATKERVEYAIPGFEDFSTTMVKTPKGWRPAIVAGDTTMFLDKDGREQPTARLAAAEAQRLLDKHGREKVEGFVDNALADQRARENKKDDTSEGRKGEAMQEQTSEEGGRVVPEETRTDEAPPSNPELDAGADALNDWTPDDDPASQLPHDGQKKQEHTGKPRIDRIIKALADYDAQAGAREKAAAQQTSIPKAKTPTDDKVYYPTKEAAVAAAKLRVGQKVPLTQIGRKKQRLIVEFGKPDEVVIKKIRPVEYENGWILTYDIDGGRGARPDIARAEEVERPQTSIGQAPAQAEAPLPKKETAAEKRSRELREAERAKKEAKKEATRLADEQDAADARAYGSAALFKEGTIPVDEILIMHSPNEGADRKVSYRGPVGKDKSMVVIVGSGHQMAVPNEWLRGGDDFAAREAERRQYEKEVADQLKFEQQNEFEQKKSAELANAKTYQTRNGWEIVREGVFYHIRDPHTKEVWYKSGSLNRVREVADETTLETTPTAEVPANAQVRQTTGRGARTSDAGAGGLDAEGGGPVGREVSGQAVSEDTGGGDAAAAGTSAVPEEGGRVKEVLAEVDERRASSLSDIKQKARLFDFEKISGGASVEEWVSGLRSQQSTWGKDGKQSGTGIQFLDAMLKGDHSKEAKAFFRAVKAHIQADKKMFGLDGAFIDASKADREAEATPTSLAPKEAKEAPSKPKADPELDAGADALNDWTPDDDPASQRPHDGASKQEYTGKPRTDRIIKALRGLVPDLSITIAKTQEEFAALVKDIGGDGVASAWGVFYRDANGRPRIVVNPNAPNVANTLFHEAAHPIIAALAHSRPDLFQKFYNEAIKADGGKYERFGNLYKDKSTQVQQEEAIVQYVADILSAIANKEIPVSTRKDSLYQQVKAFIQDILAALGWDTRSIDLSKPDNVREMAGQIAKALEKGIKITGLQPSTSPMAMWAKEMGITVEEAQRQYDAVVAQYTNKDGTKKEGWMKAPNGQATNLNELQWVQSRTPAFRSWFGDFIGDPKNASKVVDANGEPMEVYHGTTGDFDTFDPGRAGQNFNDEDERGMLFSSGTTEPDLMSRHNNVSGGNIMPVFLSLRNPLIVRFSPERAIRKFGVVSATAWFDNDKASIQQRAEDGGHDGIIVEAPEYKGHKGDTTLVAFSPDQIKSATANTGQFGPTGNIMMKADADRLVNGWYSRLRDAVNSKGRTQPASEWKNWIAARAKEGSFSLEEAKWTGLSDWLDSKGKEKVTPEEVRKFLDENRVKVEVKEGRESDDSLPASSMRSLINEKRLPGGTNYREVLVTLPPFVNERVTKYRVFNAAGELDSENIDTREKAERYLHRDAPGGRIEEYAGSVHKPENFRSSHFDEPNILVHLRLNDRTDADGRRVLFIEELQSDFGQAHRKLQETIDKNFDDIVEKMKADGVLKKRCP